MRTLIVTLLALAATGCVSTQDAPLIYVSQNTLGVQISGSPESASGSMVVGYRSLDVAYVPSVAVLTDGKSLHPIRGCYQAGHNTTTIAQCQLQVLPGNRVTSNSSESNPSTTDKPAEIGNTKPIVYPRSASPDLTETSQRVNPLIHKIQALDPRDTTERILDPHETGAAGGLAGNNGDKASSKENHAAPNGSQEQSVSDSLSVFGSFDASSQAGSSTGVKLGKIFSTGVASQNITEGINLEQRRKAYAEILQRRAECFLALKTAYGDGVKDNMAALCQ